MAHLESLGGFFTSAPDLVAWGDQDQYLTVLAVGADQALWTTTLQDAGAGSNPLDPMVWQSLGGVVTSRPSAVRAAALSVEVFATGPDSEILHWQCINGTWRTWTVHPGPPEPPVAAPVAKPAVRQGAAVGGSDPVPTPVVRPVTGFGPQPPPLPHRFFESLGGGFLGTPHATAVSRGGGCAVFAVGTDLGLWARFRSADGGFDAWRPYGGQLTSDPFAIEYEGFLFMFGRGLDSAIWWAVDGADGWHSLPGTFLSGPFAVSDGNSLYVLGTDSRSELNVARWLGEGWELWGSLGLMMTSRPTACRTSSSTLRGYAIGVDSGLWSCADIFDPYGSPWSRVGGPFLTAPATVSRTGAGFSCQEAVLLGLDHSVVRVTDLDP